MEFLRDLGCDYLQRHLISRAVPADEFTVLIERRQLLSPAGDASFEESRRLGGSA